MEQKNSGEISQTTMSNGNTLLAVLLFTLLVVGLGFNLALLTSPLLLFVLLSWWSHPSRSGR